MHLRRKKMQWVWATTPNLLISTTYETSEFTFGLQIGFVVYHSVMVVCCGLVTELLL